MTLALSLAVLFQKPWFQAWFFSQMASRSWNLNTDPPPEPRVPYQPKAPEPLATAIAQPADLFLADRIWSAHLAFTQAEWDALQPHSVRRVPGWLRPDGTLILNNTNAPRPGLAGVLGVAQPWSQGSFVFGSRPFTNAAIRFKGNGTFFDSPNAYNRPYKIDLDKHAPGRHLAGQSEINLHNLAADRSLLADALGYEFYRDAGVPAPRTTFARLFLSIEGRWESRFLGLYAVIEDPCESWLDDALGHPGGTLFKPVTMDLFLDLGTDWTAYETVYNPKSKVSDTHRQRLIDLARLVTHADDPTFAKTIFEFVDLDSLCRFLACETLLSNYDGIFTNGQNFLLWIDPQTGRFGFSPWDLDHSWGEFAHIGSPEQRIRASLLHPWVGSHRFLERVFAVPAFQTRYRAELNRLLASLFVPERLHQRIDQLADAIRPAVLELPEERVRNFEAAVGSALTAQTTNAPPPPRGRVHRLKPFITRRAEEARAQLEGRSEGVILSRRPGRER